MCQIPLIRLRSPLVDKNRETDDKSKSLVPPIKIDRPPSRSSSKSSKRRSSVGSSSSLNAVAGGSETAAPSHRKESKRKRKNDDDAGDESDASNRSSKKSRRKGADDETNSSAMMIPNGPPSVDSRPTIERPVTVRSQAGAGVQYFSYFEETASQQVEQHEDKDHNYFLSEAKALKHAADKQVRITTLVF
mgnify:CR=1 FL=1